MLLKVERLRVTGNSRALKDTTVPQSFKNCGLQVPREAA